MRKIIVFVVGIASLAFFSVSSFAAWPYVEGTVSDIRIVNNGDANDVVIVYMNVTGAGTSCTYNAFVLPKTDSYHAQTYAAMLLAKATGAPIRYLHSYCITSGPSAGFSRGNEYTVLAN